MIKIKGKQTQYLNFEIRETDLINETIKYMLTSKGFDMTTYIKDFKIWSEHFDGRGPEIFIRDAEDEDLELFDTIRYLQSFVYN